MRAFSSSGLGVVEVLGVNVKNKSKKESGPRMFCYLQVTAEFRGRVGDLLSNLEPFKWVLF